jgi:glycosyltransferase involved in cell wall biosynthesis
LTWLERQLLPGYLTLEPLLKRPLVFDVDDSIWLSKPWGVRSVAATARRADLVIAGNSVLANWFTPYARRIEIVPTAVDCSRFRPLPRPVAESGGFTVGWIGTAGNLPYLQAIEAPLAKFLRRHDDATLLVVADRPPVFVAIPADRWSFRPWSEADEAAAINAMDVGLMPLPDTEWTRGKCSYKMLQYLACGRPVVVSPVGMNGDLLKTAEIGHAAVADAEWLESLEALYARPQEAARLGANGRGLVEVRYGLQVIGLRLAELFRELV